MTPLRLRHLALLLLPLIHIDGYATEFDFHWARVQHRALLDPQEQPLIIATIRVQARADAPAVSRNGLLSRHDGLFYLNLYRDKDYQERADKLGPLPLFSLADLHRCKRPWGKLYANRDAGFVKVSETLDLFTLRFDCVDAELAEQPRYLLLDSSQAGAPLIAVGQPITAQRIDFRAWQTLPAGREQEWQRALDARRTELGAKLEKAGVTFAILPATTTADPVAQLRELHRTAFQAKDKRAALPPLEDFLTHHDYRLLGQTDSDYPRLLNDIAYWLTQAGRLETARPLLEEVLRREPQRIAAHLNLGDLDWQVYQEYPEATLYRLRAEERYRAYCGLRLANNLSVPPRVAERLQAKRLDAELCRAHWPLVEAIGRDDEDKARALLESGIPAEVIANDGRSALLHALDRPNLHLAQLLVERGAHLQGLYLGEPLAMHALRLDLKEDPNLSQAERLRFLVEAGAAVDEADHRGKTLAMQFAANHRFLQQLADLLDYPQDLDRLDSEGRTALYRAIEAQNYTAVDQLVAAGAGLGLLYEAGRCENEVIQHSAFQHFAQKVHHWNPQDAERQRASLQTFAFMLTSPSNIKLGHDCELRGHNLLLKLLVQRQRGDLISLIENFQPQRPPIDYRVTEAAIDYLQHASGPARDNAWQVLGTLLELGAPLNPNGRESLDYQIEQLRLGLNQLGDHGLVERIERRLADAGQR